VLERRRRKPAGQSLIPPNDVMLAVQKVRQLLLAVVPGLVHDLRLLHAYDKPFHCLAGNRIDGASAIAIAVANAPSTPLETVLRRTMPGARAHLGPRSSRSRRVQAPTPLPGQFACQAACI
jgi:hypothetical protein